MRSVIFSQCREWECVTGFGSFDNSTCKRVLDLLAPDDLRFGKIVIYRESCSCSCSDLSLITIHFSDCG